MKDAEIVRTYSDDALITIVRDLTKTGQWWPRLYAARAELKRRHLDFTETDT